MPAVHPAMLEPKHHALLDEAARRGLPSSDGIRLCFQVLALAGAIDRDCAARLAPRQLSEGKFVLLFLLHAQAGGLSPHELAARAGVTRATVTGLLDGLERDGFVLRQPGLDDRRRVTVTLTPKGRAAARLFKEHAQWIGSLFDGLSQAERRQLGDLLAKVWRGTDSGRAAPAGAAP
ncbi:MarR family winged helix-turn-helix transcriptional regulator [Achromobacter xylosoxidans]|uniref:MarR family winged helix-turn-helix transcriptional regulator n=1 Tax=Alcaligenes xylosoxydans xylosoxydans TaxID=85698 RepID=UPI001EECBB4E|nr:MarR family transcriptional regulator [Achromobacter xylosoxidans]